MLEMAYNIITHNSHIVLKMEDDPNNANCNWVCPACASYERPRTHFKDPNNTSNYIYEDKSSGSPTWKTCSDNLCTRKIHLLAYVLQLKVVIRNYLGMLCASRKIISF